MRLFPSCKIHQHRGKWTLMVYGQTAKALEVNESFALLWEHFDGRDFSEEDLRTHLVTEYGLDDETAATQACAIIDLWKAQELLIT